VLFISEKMVRVGTLKNGTRDGKLVVVSKDNTRCVDATDVAPNLQAAMDDWDRCLPLLQQRYADLNDGKAANAVPVDINHFHAPLPRTYEWIDGSAYIHHIVLVRKARKADPPETLRTVPLVYQGGSGTFLPPTGDLVHYSEDYGIDFESEIGVIVSDVPMGTTKEEAGKYIKLVTILNDVSLRNLIPAELAAGFGFFVSKPSTAFAPFAVTPDELGAAWRDGRLHLPLFTHLNGHLFGQPNAGPEMFFSFFDLIQHVTQTRALTAGTIIGSGTVSNEDITKGSSCLAEKRMLEQIATGAPPLTSFLKFGDVVEIEMKDGSGASLFGKIRNVVKQGHK